MAQDDWRVTVTLHPEFVGTLREALHEHAVEEKARKRLGGRVIVGGGEDDGVVFLYADSEVAASGARAIVHELLAARGIEADTKTEHWHPVEERWEVAGLPLPTTGAEVEDEHEHLEEDETAESDQLRMGLWEVRIEFESRHDAVAFADRLETEADQILPGWTVSFARHWKFILIGADNEDQANEIAQKLKVELPAGAAIHGEPSGALVWATYKPRPFAVLGGLSS